jgi:NAD(P)-dependent dehydrogenase (short-subunit alcohol dehydrogenase family)
MKMNRVALVTGGGAGMGEAACHRLSREGKSVAVLDINTANAEHVAGAINEAGGRAMAVTADITCRDQVERAVETVHTQLGHIGVLVNCAGVEHFAAFEAIDSEQWDRMLSINLKGNYQVTQTVVPDMIAQHWGRIINFSSISAQSGAAHMVHYAAAKGGVIAMTRSLALELGPKGITVNAIAPGLINTPMAQRAIEGNKFGMPVEKLVRTFPIPRMGEPDEVAAAVAFFASEDAGYITAQLLGLNGGTAV